MPAPVAAPSLEPAPAPPPPPAAPAAPPVLSVSGLTVESLRGDSLVEVFQDASLELPAGEVVLLVGPSGSGKSLFTKLLAGLVGLSTPTLRIAPTARMAVATKDGGAHDVLASGRYPDALRGAIGYMFQFHALFDELTVEENIRFGRDQSRVPLAGEAWDAWLHDSASRLKLDRLLSSPIEPLSGGQRQRASLLRMLALRPEIVVYDEPTSGLDPDAAARVADMIREVQHEMPLEARPRLSIVVTHDYANLLRIADRIALLDARRGFTVRPLEAGADRAALAAELHASLERWEAAKPRPIERRDAARIRDDAAWRATLAAPEAIRGVVRAAPRLLVRSAGWHLRFLWNAFRLLVLDAIPFAALGGGAIGLVVSYFSLNAVPQQIQGQIEPVFIEEILRGLGLGLFQILAPIFAAISLSARSGAAVAGHVSNLERSAQLDALRVLGVPPALLLGDKVIVSFAIGFPLIAAVSFASATVASLCVVLLTRPLATWYTFTTSYFAGLGHHALDLPYAGTWALLAKLVPAGIICGAIAWREGARPKETSTDVNRAITRAIMQGILAVLVVFFVVLLLEIKR